MSCVNIMIVDGCGQLENKTCYAKNMANRRKNMEKCKTCTFQPYFSVFSIWI